MNPEVVAWLDTDEGRSWAAAAFNAMYGPSMCGAEVWFMSLKSMEPGALSCIPMSSYGPLIAEHDPCGPPR